MIAHFNNTTTRARSRRVIYTKSKFEKKLRILAISSIILFILILMYVGSWAVRNAADLYPVRAANIHEPEYVTVEKIIIPDYRSDDSKNRWAAFVVAAHKVSAIYNYPVEVVLAQGALESAHGTSKYSRERNNYLGIGAYDNNPDSAFTYENPEQCVVEYMRTIKRNFPEAWSHRDNKEELLKALKVNTKGNYYASDPDYVHKVMSMSEWK